MDAGIIHAALAIADERAALTKQMKKALECAQLDAALACACELSGFTPESVPLYLVVCERLAATPNLLSL